MLPTQFFFFFLNLATFPSRFFTALLPRDRRPRSSTAGERRPLPAFASPFFSPCHPFIRLSQPFRALHGALRQRQSRLSRSEFCARPLLAPALPRQRRVQTNGEPSNPALPLQLMLTSGCLAERAAGGF